MSTILLKTTHALTDNSFCNYNDAIEFIDIPDLLREKIKLQLVFQTVTRKMLRELVKPDSLMYRSLDILGTL